MLLGIYQCTGIFEFFLRCRLGGGSLGLCTQTASKKHVSRWPERVGSVPIATVRPVRGMGGRPDDNLPRLAGSERTPVCETS